MLLRRLQCRYRKMALKKEKMKKILRQGCRLGDMSLYIAAGTPWMMVTLRMAAPALILARMNGYGHVA